MPDVGGEINEGSRETGFGKWAGLGKTRSELLAASDFQIKPTGASRGKLESATIVEELSGVIVVTKSKKEGKPYMLDKAATFKEDGTLDTDIAVATLRLLQRTMGQAATAASQALGIVAFIQEMKTAFIDTPDSPEKDRLKPVLGFRFEATSAGIDALITRIEAKLGEITDVQDWNITCTKAGRTSLLRRLTPVAPPAVEPTAPREEAHGAQGHGAPKPSKYSLVDWSKLAISAGNVNTSNALGIIQYYQSRASMAATITCGKHVSAEVAAEALTDYHNAMAAADYWFTMVYDGVGAHTDAYKKYRKRGRSESGEADKRDEGGASKGSDSDDDDDADDDKKTYNVVSIQHAAGIGDDSVVNYDEIIGMDVPTTGTLPEGVHGPFVIGETDGGEITVDLGDDQKITVDLRNMETHLGPALANDKFWVRLVTRD